MFRRPGSSRIRLAGIAVAAGLLVGLLPGSAVAVSDPHTLVATLDGSNMPYPGGDPGGSGTFSLALDRALARACFVLDVSLSDPAGDPATAIDIHDSFSGDPGDVVLALASSVDGSGHASGCVAASVALINSMLATPNRFDVVVHTAGYPGGAVRGWIEYSYPTGELSVVTRVCPAAIQSVAQLTDETKASCLVVVLPADDVAKTVPAGYTVTGYGGTAVFDYRVSDGKNLDATIAAARRGGDGTCSDVTKSCNWNNDLPYHWDAGMGEISVTPTQLPAGMRFGTAEAADGQVPGGPMAVSIGAGNQVTVDATGKVAVSVFVYLFRTSGATYHALTPTRLLDTRSGNGLAGTFKAKVARTFQVTGRGLVPANAIGVTGNLTVTGQTAGGYLYLGPTATNTPASSTLNFPAGDNRANGLTVALGSGGKLSATYVAPAGNTTQVIFDVTGYFTP